MKELITHEGKNLGSENYVGALSRVRGYYRKGHHHQSNKHVHLALQIFDVVIFEEPEQYNVFMFLG